MKTTNRSGLLLFLCFFQFTQSKSPEVVQKWSVSNIAVKDNAKPIYELNSNTFYEVGKVIELRKPTGIELAEYVLNKKIIQFDIGTKHYNLYPTRYIEEVKNNDTKILGRFSHVTIVKNEIILKYINGDKAVYGQRYSASIRFAYADLPEYQRIISSSPDKFLFEIKINQPVFSVEISKVAVQNNKKSIGNYLTDLLQIKYNKRSDKITKIIDQIYNGSKNNDGKSFELMQEFTKSKGDNDELHYDLSKLTEIKNKLKRSVNEVKRKFEILEQIRHENIIEQHLNQINALNDNELKKTDNDLLLRNENVNANKTAKNNIQEEQIGNTENTVIDENKKNTTESKETDIKKENSVINELDDGIRQQEAKSDGSNDEKKEVSETNNNRSNVL